MSMRSSTPSSELQFGKPIGRSSSSRSFSRRAANVTAASAWWFAWPNWMPRQDDGRARGAVEGFCTARMRETVAWARELLGGNGNPARLQRRPLLRRCRALYSYEGTYQMQTLIVGKAVNGFQRLRVTRRFGLITAIAKQRNRKDG